jgi:RHS repeat-associated protein
VSWGGLASILPVSDAPPSIDDGFQTNLTNTTITYIYDSMYRLTAADYDSGEFFHYTYDPVGNRLTQETLSGTNTYVYDAANRLVEVDGVAFSWDANGNLLSDGGRAFTYDNANRLIALSDQGTTYTYGYNGFGDRLVQSVDGVPTTYTLDMNTGLTQVLTEGANTYLYGLSRIGELQPGDWIYHLPDVLGSVRQISDPTTLIGASQSFEPFGTVISRQGSSTSSYGFVGEWRDSSELIHLRARYLESEWGRFFTRDPWRGSAFNPSGLHPYSYARSNPILYRDPSGRCYGVLSFLRGIEAQSCQNLDMAHTIISSPNASAWEKAGAWAFATIFTASHATLAAGTLLLSPGAAIKGAAIGGGYSAIQHGLARSGACGCEAQLAALQMNSLQAFGHGVGPGFFAGGVFGKLINLGGWGKVAAGSAGIGLSGYGLYSSGTDIVNQGLNPCNGANFGFSVIGLGLSAYLLRSGIGDLRNPPTAPEAPVGTLKYIDNQGRLRTAKYVVSNKKMDPHLRGSLTQGKSQFLSFVDAESAVLDAAHFADDAGLWIKSGDAWQATVFIENGPIGVLGRTGELTSYLTITKTNTGFIHGWPSNP